MSEGRGRARTSHARIRWDDITIGSLRDPIERIRACTEA